MEPSTNKFVYEHIIIFESICLQVKPKFRLQHDSSIYIYIKLKPLISPQFSTSALLK